MSIVYRDRVATVNRPRHCHCYCLNKFFFVFCIFFLLPAFVSIFASECDSWLYIIIFYSRYLYEVIIMYIFHVVNFFYQPNFCFNKKKTWHKYNRLQNYYNQG